VLLVGVLALVGRSLSDTKVTPPAPQSRVALVNLTLVLKNYNKVKDWRERLQNEAERFQQTAVKQRAQVESLTKEASAADTTTSRREQIEGKVKRLRREMEDRQEKANKELTAKQNQMSEAFYAEVRRAAEHCARARGIELVLHYSNFGSEKPDSPNVTTRLRERACMPLYAAPGVDITQELIDVLNSGRHDNRRAAE
jgi:Skp family chaperone for outer membrane proteins